MDIYAPQALAQERRAYKWGHRGCCTSGAGICGLCRRGTRPPEQFNGVAAASAKMSLNKGRSAAPGVGCYNAM